MMKCLPPEELESQYVHHVYDAIANDFDHTRYRPWPAIRHFVNSLSPGSLLLDLGCGNGRNLCINRQVIDIGCDYSMPLCSIAHQRGRPIFCGSALTLPIRDCIFDHIICIAVIHHFATASRRVSCLREVSRVLRPGGTALITAWATDQKKKKYTEADQMVPWTVDGRFDSSRPKFDRFYHLFQAGEFQALVGSVDSLELIEEKWDTDNWNAIIRKIVSNRCVMTHLLLGLNLRNTSMHHLSFGFST
jgi:SAM-dependent methyltransferase